MASMKRTKKKQHTKKQGTNKKQGANKKQGSNKKQGTNKSLKYASNKKTPFKRGGFEKKQKFNTVTPKLHTMTHDFLFRNVYKKAEPLSDEKRNHPTSHYRYKFHHSNVRKNINTDDNNQQANKYQKQQKHHKRHSQNVKEANDPQDIPFYDDIDKSKKEYLSDNELDIASSSNEDSDDGLTYDNFRKDSLKRKHVNRKLASKSKWLQSKLRENTELFEGGLDLQGQLPYKNTVKKKKFVTKHSLVLGCIHSIHEHFVRLYLYGSIPATLTIREVSDVLSTEIDHLITTKKGDKKSLLHIKSSLKKEGLIAHKRSIQLSDATHRFHYNSLEKVPTCHNIFKRNQIIRCIVTHSTENEGYHVSLRPSLFNAKLRMNDMIKGYAMLCSIKSVEDKGYVIDTGIYVQDKGGDNEIAVRGFMNYADVDPNMLKKILHLRKGQNADEAMLPVGFPLELVVKRSDTDTHSVWFTVDFKQYYRELSVFPRVPIAALKPGFNVKCHIKRILADGLVVEFAKVYQGVISYSHMDQLLNKKWRDTYTIGKQIDARIILIHPEKHIIHLSIKPHLVQQLQYQLLPNALSYDINVPRRCNEIIKADVRRIAYDNVYLYTKLLDPLYVNLQETDDSKQKHVDPEYEEQLKLFPAKNKEALQQMIPIRVTEKHLAGKGKTNLSNERVFNQWKHRTNLEVKLLRFDGFQGEFQGTLKGSEVKARVLFYKDIKHGMIFECTITAIDTKHDKIDVAFCNGLVGHISILHAAEKPPQSLDEPRILSKYKIGNVIKCRVLTCIAFKKSVNLTAKPSLVENDINHKDPMTIFSWGARKNTISRAVVFKLNDVMGYIVVHFYNSVTAVIPSKDLKANGYLNKVSDEFFLGQTIQVRVINSMQKKKRMLCSLNLNTEQEEKDETKENQGYDRTLYWSKIVAKKEGCFIVKKLINYSANESDVEEDIDAQEEENKEITFDQLRLYSVLPFNHLCDNSAQSMQLVQSNAFEIGDKVQVLTLHRIKVTRSDIEKQLNYQIKMIESLGLSPNVLQFKQDKKVLSIVSAKTGLMRLHRKQLTHKVFPINSRGIETGDVLMGYVSSNRYPSTKHALWIHFKGLLQIPVAWTHIHDLNKTIVTECIKTSFTQQHNDENRDFNLSMYKQGDLVMAKVMEISQLPSDIQDGGRHLVHLTMKPSDLYAQLSQTRQGFFNKTSINEWFLSYKQQQALFMDKLAKKEEDEENEDSDSDEDMLDTEQKQAQHDNKAALNALHVGSVLQCTINRIEDSTIIVDFIPALENVKGVINVHRKKNLKIYNQHLVNKKVFKTNVVNIDWNEDEAVIELYDVGANAALFIIQEAPRHTFVIASRAVIHNAMIVYVSLTHLLIQFGVESSKTRRYIGIIPMRLPYLVVPTTLLFKVGDVIDAAVVQASNHYGGVIVCRLMYESLDKHIRKYNKKHKKENASKRKLEEMGTKHLEPPNKKRKVSRQHVDVVKSAKSNVLGTAYGAVLVESDPEQQHFVVNAKHFRLPNIVGGILPYEQLCDHYATSMKLAESYHQLLQENKTDIMSKDIMLKATVIDVTEDDIVLFTTKNMVVSHCKNRGWPRFNAYQIRKRYPQIKRNVPMMGSVHTLSKSMDALTVHHGNQIMANVDYNDALMLPFDRKEIAVMYPKGQTVIGHIESQSKLQKGAVSMHLCELKNMENIDIMASNQSFMREYQRVAKAKYDLNHKQNIAQLDVHIGDVIDVKITNVTATCFEFEYRQQIKGTIIRPQHSGAELEEFEAGMKTEILVIDIDYHSHEICGSIRLCHKAPKESHDKNWMNSDKPILCQLECVSDNGYLVLQIIGNNHFIIVPFATPYFHFTFIQTQLYFKIGAKFKVTIIQCMHFRRECDENKNVYLGYIPSWIKANRGYLHNTMNDIICNPSKYYKPYDTRYSHPAQILYSQKPVRALCVKLYASSSQGHIGEIAPGLYPKIVIAAPESSHPRYDSYLILEDKVDTAAIIKVNINTDYLCNSYSNTSREIVISVNDVIMDAEHEISNTQDIEMHDNNENEDKLKVGQIVDVMIQSVSKHGIFVNILNEETQTQSGYVEAIHASDSIKEILKLQTDPESFLSSDILNVMIGEECKAVVIATDTTDSKHIQLSLQKSVMKKYYKLQQLLTNAKILRLDIGQEINGIVSKIVPEHGLFVDLGIFGVAELHITNAIAAENAYHQINLKEMFCMNEIIRCRVIAVDKDTEIIHVSIKHLSNPNHIETPLVYNDVIRGSLVSGIVSMIDAKLGIIVWLSRYIKGRISFKHLSASSISYQEAAKQYAIGTMIKDISVLHVSATNKRIELSVIEAVSAKEQKMKFLSYHLNEMAIGDFVTAIFQRKLRDGNLFVYVPGSDFKYGVIPKSEISHHLLKGNAVNDMIRGDKIQVWVFKIIPDLHNKMKVYFTMKSRSLKLHQSSAEFSKQQAAEIKRNKRRRAAMNMMREYKTLQEVNMNMDSDEEEDEIQPLNAPQQKDIMTRKKNEEENINMEDDNHDMDDDEAMQDMDTLQKEAVVVADKTTKVDEIKTEENVEWNELMKSEGFTSKPRTPKDFERLLVGSPDSSIVWIEYIAFYLGKKNVVKARNVISRALKQIHVSEDKERLNIWIAWMNLEMLYGTQTLLIDVFKKALASNDQKDVYSQFVGVCQENEKYDLCHKYYTQMLHKFSTDSNVYINYGRFLYQQFKRSKNGEYLEEARDLLKRAIQNLPIKAQHVSLIQKFAYNEYKYVKFDDAALNIKNEGKSMFEGLLRKYCNKPNIWNVYALAVYRYGAKNSKLQEARGIFERGLKKKKMKMHDTKSLFKQYLSFENKYGSGAHDHKENVAHIKQLAKQYVSALAQAKSQ